MGKCGFIPPVLALLLALVGMSAPAEAQARGFVAPSGNILCYLDAYEYGTGERLPLEQQPLVCLIFEADWTLPEDYGDDDPICDLDRTRSVTLQPQGKPEARWFCHGDVFWPLPLPTIDYGSNWSVAGRSCTMRRDGVRCQNVSGHGFHVRRARLTLN